MKLWFENCLLIVPSQWEISFISLLKAKLSLKVILSPLCHVMHTSQVCSVCPDSKENRCEWATKHGVHLHAGFLKDKHMCMDSSPHFWQMLQKKTLIRKIKYFTWFGCNAGDKGVVYMLSSHTATASHSTLKCVFPVRMSVFVLDCVIAHCQFTHFDTQVASWWKTAYCSHGSLLTNWVRNGRFYPT